MMAAPSWEALLPARMRSLPRDHRGFPVPWFVTEKDEQGRWDFRLVQAGMVPRAVKERRCWVCGQPLGRYMAFVAGPMCLLNRTSAEPPSHRECAEFSAQVCPFLTKPRMRRNEKGMPEDTHSAGIMLTRNPGVAAVYVTRSFQTFRPPRGGMLITMGNPTEVVWYREGRFATRMEVAESIRDGMPALIELAQQDGPDAVNELQRRFLGVLSLLPAEVPDAA